MTKPQSRVSWRLALPLISAGVVAGFGLGFLVVTVAVNPARQRARAEFEAQAHTSQALPTAPGTAPADGASPAASVDTSKPASDKPTSDAGEPTSDAGTSDKPTSDAGKPTSDAAPALPADLDPSDAGLKPYEAYLYVRSSKTADVWVQGIKLGSTNQKLKLACTTGLRFTRLGQEPGPSWISTAVSIKIPCGTLTHIELEPSPQPLQMKPGSE